MKYSDEYVERLAFAAAEMQMCLELMISIVHPGREPLVSEDMALGQSKMVLDTYHQVLRDFANC